MTPRRFVSRCLLALSIAVLPVRASGGAPPADCLAALDVSLNEVRCWDGTGPGGIYLEPLVEIFNAGSMARSLSGWSLRDAAGNILFALPPLALPARCYLVVHFGVGDLDADFADSLAHVYTGGDSVNVLGNLSGAVGLFDASAQVRDFVTWSSNGSPPSGSAYAAAVSAGLWPAGAIALAPDTTELLYTIRRIPQGYTHPGAADLDWIAAGWAESDYSLLTAGANVLQRSPRDGHGFEPDSSQHLFWCPVDGAKAYHLEVVAMLDSTEDVLVDRLVTTSDTIVALPFGSYRWSVAPLDECAELDGRSWWEFSVDTLASPGAERLRWSADAALASRDLEVEKLTQRKDSKLLCLWDQVRRQHPGCTFELGKSGPWNDSHPYEHAIDIDIRRRRAEKILCPHCAMYCARATIQMVNNFFRGNKRFDDVANDLKALTQDHISTQLRIAGDPRDASPEGDLGHGAGGGFGGSTDNSARVTLEWAVTNSKVTGTIVRSTLTYAAVKTEIDAGSPLAVTNVQHMYLFDGYEDAHEEAVAGKKVKVPDRVHIVDPSPGEQLTKQGWTSAAKCLPEIFATWSIRSVGGGKVLTGREEDASVWADTDFDGIRDFDEGLDPVTKKLAANAPRLLQSDPTSTDTDGDGIEDKWEVVAYTYHTSQHATHNPGSDPDRDNLRAENDKDSDNDGDADGNEDTNQNGNYEPNLKETDVFDANSKAQKVKAKKGGGSPADAFAIAEGDTVFLTTDHVLLDGDTYAVSHTFPYRVYAQCPPPLVPVTPYPSGPTLVRSGLLASDAQGDLIPIDLGTFPPGCYAVALDALADGLYGYITVDPFTGDAGAGLADTVIHFQVNATTDVDRSLVLSAAASAADGAVRLVWTLPANVLGGTVRIERREVIDGVPYALAASVAAKPGDDAWLDPGLEHPGRYSYRLSIVLPDGRSASWSQGVVVDPPRLRVWTSSAPTDPVVAVHFMLPRAGAVRLEAFDAQGRRVARLCEGRGTMGANTVLVPASAVPNGAVTFVALRFGGARTGCRLVRVR